jgi:hypothetical protein
MNPDLNIEKKQIRVLGVFVSRHKRRNPWTIAEFEILRNGFMSGKRIKVIANEIGRSPTAVNKFISRSGLKRTRKVRTR